MKQLIAMLAVAALLLVGAWLVDSQRAHRHYVDRVARLPVGDAEFAATTVGEELSKRHPDGRWFSYTGGDGHVYVEFAPDVEAEDVVYEWRMSDDNLPFPAAITPKAEELTPNHVPLERILERAREG